MNNSRSPSAWWDLIWLWTLSERNRSAHGCSMRAEHVFHQRGCLQPGSVIAEAAPEQETNFTPSPVSAWLMWWKPPQSDPVKGCTSPACHKLMMAGCTSRPIVDGCHFTSSCSHPKIYYCMSPNHKKQYKLLMTDKVIWYCWEPEAPAVTQGHLFLRPNAFAEFWGINFVTVWTSWMVFGCLVKNKSTLY